MKIDCIICGKNNLNKNTIGINKNYWAKTWRISTVWIALPNILGVLLRNCLIKSRSSKRKAVNYLNEVGL